MLRETISLDGLRVCFLYGMLKSSRELTSTSFVERLVPRCGDPVSCRGGDINLEPHLHHSLWKPKLLSLREFPGGIPSYGDFQF